MLACAPEPLNGPPMSSLAKIVLVASCLASPALAQEDTPNEWWPEPRPTYQVLRQNEDWSVLLREPQQDVWDPVKFIRLDDDGDAFASIGGSARVRGEGWRGFGFEDGADDEYALSRALLHMDLHIGPHVRLFAEGRTAQSTERSLPGGHRPGDVDYLDVQQLFVDIAASDLGDVDSVTLRPGRQLLSFGSERLVSPLDWSNAMRTWDGVSLAATAYEWTVTAFWALFVPIDSTDLNEEEADEKLFGLYATRPADRDEVSTDAYWLVNRRVGQSFNGTTGREDRHTLGLRLWGQTRLGIDYELEGAFQTGELNTEHISAFMLSYEAGYTLEALAARGWVGFDYASGDEEPGGSVQTFSQLYPNSHDHLGITDAIGRQNITDGSAGIEWTPRSNLELNLAGHVFWLANENDALYDATGTAVRAGGTASSRFIGTELDLTAKLYTGDHLVWSLGYGHFFTDSALRQSGSSEDVDFFYVGTEYVF